MVTLVSRNIKITALILALVLTTIGTPRSAEASSPCGAGYTLAKNGISKLRHLKLVVMKSQRNWCAFALRTGEYAGVKGLTRVGISADDGRPFKISDDYFRYNAGPVKISRQHKNVYAIGSVGTMKNYTNSTVVGNPR